MIITDAQVHVWEASTPERPWNPGRVAQLPEPFSYEDLRQHMKKSGVDRVVLVPPSFLGDRSDYSLEAAAKYPEQFAVMGRVPLEKRAQGEAMLKGWKDQPGMLGVRLTLHHEWDAGWVKDGTADWFWPIAEKMNIPLMLNAPSVLKEIGGIAERHPNLRLIIDHMGRLKGQKDDKLIDGVRNTLALAKHPNVHVKLSLAPTCSTDVYPYRNIHDTLHRVIDAFGPRRSFWASDLSALMSLSDCTYRQSLTMFTEEMKFLSADDLEWIMGRALSECLPWPVAPGLKDKRAA